MTNEPDSTHYKIPSSKYYLSLPLSLTNKGMPLHPHVRDIYFSQYNSLFPFCNAELDPYTLSFNRKKKILFPNNLLLPPILPLFQVFLQI